MNMLYAKVPMGGIVMPEHEEAIAKALNMSKEAIARLTSGEDYVTENLEIVPLGKGENAKVSDVKIGAEAIEALMDCKGIDSTKVFNVLDEIEVPRDVFQYCNSIEWYDICTLFGRAESRFGRVLRLLHFDNLPAIIGCCEYRMMREAVILLDANGVSEDYCPLTRDDESIIRSLGSIGYSLENGWSEEMEKYFQKKIEEY
jgi:hypothetical protein